MTLLDFGIKQVMLFSMIAWVLRFGLFAYGNPGDGYMTVYLKAGIPGLLLLFGSIFYFFRKQSSVNDLDHNIN